MEKEIVNRVAGSKLVTIDLEDFYPEGSRIQLDISDWLMEGIVLKEKEFRSYANTHDWSQYTNCFVALHCSTDAIIPGWAYMLISLKLTPFAKTTIVGSLEMLETVLFSDIINKMDFEPYKDKPVIIKGCTQKPIPPSAYIFLSQKLQPVAQKVMYGEACSSVPLFKKK